MTEATETFDAVVVGGGPAGSTAATELARRGCRILLLDRPGRVKPCGGAIPPRLVEDFGIPEALLKTRIGGVRIVSPRGRTVEMPIEGGYVGMVDRDEFDPWLRERASLAGAVVRDGAFEALERGAGGRVGIRYRPGSGERGKLHAVRARAVIGADGARSAVARDAMPDSPTPPFVAAYHEIIESPPDGPDGAFDGTRCDVWYQGRVSPDFYGWVFPHGGTTSVGVGSARRGFSLRGAVRDLRDAAGLSAAATHRREGAPIPLAPRRRWDDGANVVLAGDAAGVVAPASGEGIYYAMTGGRLAADSVAQFLESGDARALALARRRFMREHGRVFWILGMMQRFWYASDRRRERFVTMCADPDVQHLTWQAYMHKRLVRARPAAHARIFFKDLAHLLGMARV